MNDKYFIIDGHLDLAMNAMEWNRDYTRPVNEIREMEAGMTDKPDRAKGTVSFSAMRQGNVGICIATQIARYVKPGNKIPGWNSPWQAWAHTQGQLAWYRAMEEKGELRMVRDLTELENHLKSWQKKPENCPIGYILSLEGADSILTPAHLERSYEQGLRAIGPAHYGPGTYAQGTDSTGGFNEKGRKLLREIERLNMILDMSHLSEDCFWEAMDLFKGYLWASHNNCRVFVNHNRQFSDDQIKALIERDAVIGAVLDAWMLIPDWDRQKSTPETANVTLDLVVKNIDHICQLAGNSRHTAIGSDLDGAFGREQSPLDIDTIADLQKIPTLLLKRGYKEEDIQNIMHANWLRFLQKAWI